MNEKTDSKIHKPELIYSIEVRIPDLLPIRIEVIDQILAGLDPRNDLILIDPKIKAKHFLFSHKDQVLTLHYFGKDGDTFLNGLALENAKNYILEKADHLKVGKIEIIIHRELGTGKFSYHEKTKTNLKISELQSQDSLLKNLNESEHHTEHIAEHELENTGTLEAAAHKIVHHEKTNESNFGFSNVSYIPYKFYGFIVDLALTYLILSFILPSLGLMNGALNILYPISAYLSQLILFSIYYYYLL